MPKACFEGTLRLINGKWKGEILWNLGLRRMRFGELMRAIPGITQHMLTAQLRDLERHGLVTRTAYAEVPPRVEYDVTPAARALKDVFETLLNWTRTYADVLNLGEVGRDEARDDPRTDAEARPEGRRRAG